LLLVFLLRERKGATSEEENGDQDLHFGC
jgi:hypothetical protein